MDIRIDPNDIKLYAPNRLSAAERTLPQNSASNAPDFGPAYLVDLSGQRPKMAQADETSESKTATGKAEETEKSGECQTCKNRKYQDASDDAGVSFKAPGHIAPENSASVVLAHEQEHINIAQNESKQDKNTEIVSQSIRTYSGTCAECGKTYVAGGEATTVTRTTSTPKKEKTLGKTVDIAA